MHYKGGEMYMIEITGLISIVMLLIAYLPYLPMFIALFDHVQLIRIGVALVYAIRKLKRI